MVKRFKVIAAGLMAASCLVAAGPAAAQCYPGLACPPSVEPPPPPENTKPLTQEDKTAIQSGKRSYWTHNGSVVYLTAEGAKRSFFYHVPRPGVRDAGAKPGALLFEGKREGQSYSGTAYVFAGRCGTIPYQVRGSVSNQEQRVTLEGQAPSGISGDCHVTGTRRDVLVFDFSHRE